MEHRIGSPQPSDAGRCLADRHQDRWKHHQRQLRGQRRKQLPDCQHKSVWNRRGRRNRDGDSKRKLNSDGTMPGALRLKTAARAQNFRARIFAPSPGRRFGQKATATSTSPSASQVLSRIVKSRTLCWRCCRALKARRCHSATSPARSRRREGRSSEELSQRAGARNRRL